MSIFTTDGREDDLVVKRSSGKVDAAAPWACWGEGEVEAET